MITGPAHSASPGNLLEMTARTTIAGAQQMFAGDNADFLILMENDATNTML